MQLGRAELNFETRAQFTLNVTVTDDGTPSLSASLPLNIGVTDRNDPPSNFRLSGQSVV